METEDMLYESKSQRDRERNSPRASVQTSITESRKSCMSLTVRPVQLSLFRALIHYSAHPSVEEVYLTVVSPSPVDRRRIACTERHSSGLRIVLFGPSYTSSAVNLHWQEFRV